MNAVLYLRSAVKDEEKIKQQRTICQELAAELNAIIDAEFVDNGVPGQAADRPGLRALLSRLDKTHVDCVIMTHGYRLARKMDQYLKLITQIGSFGTTVVTLDKHVYIFGGKRS
ncbi:MAG TPA: recombinase family protein [Candidatus Saccharimonadia bacterium]|jgi:DNA invertase Pin-like site-specific DNA recombinase|nr:recombinase family protein [Candidatus Saccharimonadia bacterium]